ncbi:MAG: hypothetical protein DWB45_12005 [Xanthomonadales bacterium]|nr:hypothetical protein [Xanthomonadales bacterium]MDL1870059.1 hypothetical protein [Gammaproteobacteria bacterium PRO6]
MSMPRAARSRIPALLLLACAMPAAAAARADDPPAAPAAVTYLYRMLPGLTFHPASDGMEYATDSGTGCIHHTGGLEQRLVHSVELPAGVTIDFVRFFYFDTSPTGHMKGYYADYDAAGNQYEIASSASGAVSGYGSVLITVNRTIDHRSRPVELSATLTGTDDSVRFCGARIRYFADVIFTNGFD